MHATLKPLLYLFVVFRRQNLIIRVHLSAFGEQLMRGRFYLKHALKNQRGVKKNPSKSGRFSLHEAGEDELANSNVTTTGKRVEGSLFPPGRIF